jgi:phospholipase C
VPCWSPKTLADELDAKGLSWAYYAAKIQGPGVVPSQNCGGAKGPDVTKGASGYWSAYQAIKSICYGPDWDKDIISPPAQILNDVHNGNLRAVTWLTPTDLDSDHPGNGSDTGPSWVASVVNAIGESKFWDSTAIFIFWDDPGGWYDPEKPKYVGKDEDETGFRLPLLIVSPYAKQGWVSQVPYNHGSILKFIEDRFGLAPLAFNDKHATSPENDCFDFSLPPREFVTIESKYPESYFLHEPDDFKPPDTD